MSTADALTNAFNFTNQQMGSMKEDITQAAGIATLAFGMPQRADEVRRLAGEFRAQEDSIWDPVSNRIRQNRDALAGAFGDPNEWKALGAEGAQYFRDSAKDAEQGWADAKGYTNEVRTNNTAATQAFNKARKEGLADLTQTKVYDAASVTGSAIQAGREASRNMGTMLANQGYDPTDPAVAKATADLTSEYRRQLGDGVNQVQSQYMKSRVELHTNFANAQVQLEGIKAAALGQAIENEQRASAKSVDAKAAAGVGVVDSYDRAAAAGQRVMEAVNAMDVTAASIDAEKEYRNQEMLLKAEDLITLSLTSIAGALLNYNISVPQMARPAPKAPDSGGGGFSLGANLGPVTAGYSSS